jgi:hypothetical protein
MQRSLASIVLVLASSLAACSKSESAAAPATTTGPLAPHLLASAPANAKDVLAVRASAKPGDEVVVRGRVKDFVASRAVAVVIDPSKQACDEAGPMDDCPTPWDFCCDPPDEINAASIAVDVRDASGTIKQGLQGFAGLDHLDTLVAQGTLEVDPQGNPTVVAKSFYVEKRSKP